jgi:hypothetical protein
MAYNAVHSTCPFVFDGDYQPYTIPDQDSLIDPKIVQLVQTPRLPSPPALRSTLPVMASERFRNDVLIRSLCNASRYVRFIMDPGHHPQYVGRPAVYDSQVVLWNILDASGPGSIAPQNLQRLVDTLHPDLRRDATSEFQCRYTI